MIEKKIVYLPNKSCEIIDNTIVLPNGTKFQGTEGYFFTQEQLNQYTKDVIKESVEISAKNAYVSETFGGMSISVVNKNSITNSFDEIYKKLKL